MIHRRPTIPALLAAALWAASCSHSLRTLPEPPPLQKGIELYYQGRYEEAERRFHVVADSAEKAADTLLNVRALKWLGNVQRGYAKNDEAFALYREAERLLRARLRGDSLRAAPGAESLRELDNVLNNEAVVEKNNGRYAEAKRIHEEVLARDLAAGNREGAAGSLMNLGVVEYLRSQKAGREGKLIESGARLEEAGARLRSSLRQEETADAWLNLGDVYAWRYALASFDTAAARALIGKETITGGDAGAYRRARSFYDSAYGSTRARDLDSAISAYRAARKVYAERGYKVNEALCLGNIGVLLRERGDAADAIPAFRDAIAIVEALRGELSSIDVRSGFISDKYYLYENLIDLLVAEGRVDEAFAAAERAKARSFLDMIGNRSIGAGKQRPPEEQELIAREKEIQQRMGRIVRNPDSSEVLVDLIEEHQSILNTLRKKDPEYTSVKNIEPLSLAELQKILPDSAALVEYYVGTLAAYVFVVRSDSAFARRLAAGRLPDLEQRIARLRRKFFSVFPNAKMGKIREGRLEKNLTPDRARAAWYASRPDASWQADLIHLDTLLLRPVAAMLAGKKELIFVPHAFLHQLPFHALVDPADSAAPGYAHLPRPRYLIERFTVSYLPSASVLKFIRLKESRRSEKALIVGDPLYADPEYRKQPLEGALIEADSVQHYFSNPLLLERAAAEESVVKKDMAATDVVHLATHGELNTQEPLQSRILLAAAHPQGDDDGNLTVAEVFNLNLHSSLVTLSVCQTAQVAGARGANQQGDELVGLTRSFLYAGTPAVIASLWYVDDAATLTLMTSFYRHWTREGMSKTAAIRRAILDMLERPADPDWIFPYYWAAFVLTGID